MSHDKNNSHLHYIEHQNDPNALACMRSSLHMPKHQANIHSSHRSHPNPSSVNRPVMTSSAGASMPGNNGAGYMMHNFQHQPVGQVSPHRQHTQVPSHHLHHAPHFSSSSRNMYPYESLKPKDQISIQEYMNKSVDEFVRSNSKLIENYFRHISTSFFQAACHSNLISEKISRKKGKNDNYRLYRRT